MTFRKRSALTSRQLLATSLIVLWLGFFVRLHNLAGDSFWIDEILTVQEAQAGPQAFLSIRDHPPLMYTMTSLAIQTFGQTEFGARLPSLIAGTLAIALTILMGKVLHRPMIGLWAAVLLAVSPVHIAYSQEARHYALLLTISLATYIVLFWALKKPRWSFWLAYAFLTALNLYNHYAAFVVLASQALLIGGWLLSHWRRKDLSSARRIWRYPAIGGLIVTILYLPWLSRLSTVAQHNLGSDAATGTGGIAPLNDWIVLLFRAFGMYRAWLPQAMLIVVLVGLAIMAWRRKWLNLSLIASATVLPLILIQLFQVSRGVYARYVLYMLPFYLLAAAVGVITLLEWLIRRQFGRRAYLFASAILAAFLLVIAGPGVKAEHERVQEDWRGILDYVDGVAEDGDVLVGVSMNYRNRFNLVAASLPYYLGDAGRNYVWLPAGQFGSVEAAKLDGHQGAALTVVFDWNEPAALLDAAMDVKQFQTALFVGREVDQPGDSLDQTISLYDELIVAAQESKQACLFKEDLALLLTADGQADRATTMLDQVEKACPELTDRARFMSARIEALDDQLDEAVADGRRTEAEDRARQLLRYRPDHDKALEALTEYNLLELWSTAQADVDERGAPEPIQIRRFTMPDEGDAREAILIHPPAGVTYRLALPDGRPVLRTRLALAPESWSWGGDGATFIASIQSKDGAEETLLRRHIGNNEQDHVWHVVEIPLQAYAGQVVTLTLSTETGPAGDGTGDWAGWETPRILRGSPDS